MATATAITIETAIAFAAANVGGHFMIKAIDGDSSGDRSEALLEERKRRNRALEKYQKDIWAWERKQQEPQDWEEHREIERQKAKQELCSVGRALDLYAQTHPASPPAGSEPQ